MNSKTAIILYPRVNKFSSRILREAKALLDGNIVTEVLIFALHHETELPKTEHIDTHIRVERLSGIFSNGPKTALFDSLRFLEFAFLCLVRGRYYRPQFIIPHSLSVLPTGVLFKTIYGAKLVYSPHELETEAERLHSVRQRIMKLIERTLIQYATMTIVVGEYIKRWYVKEYNLKNIVTIRNIPLTINNGDNKDVIELREYFQINKSEPIFIYQGKLSLGRSVHVLIDAFNAINSHIIFMGFVELQSEVEAAAERSKYIHFLPAVPPEMIIHFSKQADFGISLIENTCLSFYYSVPNKLFEYLQSGIPVLVSDFPEMNYLVTSYGCGLTCSPNKEGIMTALKEVKKLPKTTFLSGIAKFNEEINWSTEKRSMIHSFREIS
jgi:glycosyltransferase involved in cell wall biosynthesis